MKVRSLARQLSPSLHAPVVVLTCPSNQTVAACQTQAAVDAAYATWLTTVSFSGGCNAAISNNSMGAPPACGGSVTVTWTVTSTCESPVTCAATFTVTNAPAVVISCPANQTEPPCQTQGAIDAAFAAWLASGTFSGGCNGAISNNAGMAPPACGGSTTVIWTVTSTCETPVSCSAIFTVTDAPAVVLTCPSNQTEAACQTQTAIDNAFTNWLNSATFSGGCNAAISNNGGAAPSACGGSTTVIWTVTSSCTTPVTCSAVFTVSAAPLVNLNCAANQTEAACQTQAVIDAAYATWLASATFTGGCNAMISNNGGSAPPACGGAKTVIWTVTSSCQADVTCSAVFTVNAAPLVVLNCATNQTEAACQTQAAIDAAYTAWLATATFSGGCNASISNNGGAAPPACGGSKTVIWTVTSTCEANVTCSAVFTVTDAPVVTLTCPTNQTEAACQTQAAIDAAFNTWLTTVSFSGGCSASISNNSAGAPPACGGSVTVTWTVTSTCEGPVTCAATFTVTNAPAVVLTCPSNQTVAACQSQAAVDAAYNSWLTTVSFSGGCSASISNNSAGAPPACGGSVTVTWTVTSTCEGPVTCAATFTVTAAPAVVLTCPSNQTVAACQTQAAVDAAYNTWLTTVSFSGGCSASLSNNSAGAPPACGGSVTVTWTVTSTCEGPVTCAATFTVTAAPAVVLTCPSNQTVAACQTQAAVDAAYNTWLTTVSFSGGCNAAISNNSAGAPPACGGSVTVTWTVTSTCEGPVTCMASFTVTAAPAVNLNCATNQTEAPCQTQAAIDAAFTNWLNSATFSGGCNAAISNNGGAAPSACGGSATVTWTVTSTCEGPVTCSAVFTVTAAPLVVLNCASNQTEAPCQTQAAIDAAFNTWLNTTTFSGGCNAAISNSGGAAPSACGGATTVTWTVTSSCEANVTCSAVFTVTAAPLVVLNCATNQTEAACQTQAAIDAAYATWLATATFTGGCNATISNNGGSAPPACGGSKTVTWTVTSTCEANVTCSAVFTVTDAPVVTLTCPTNQTEVACQTQAAIDAAYNTWLTTVSFSGGCSASISNNSAGAPPACGGSVTVTWTVTSTCEGPVTCAATFTVTAAPAVVLTCPSNQTVAACQTQAAVDAAFNTWLTTVSFSGGCSAAISNNSTVAPPACGGSVTVTWTVTSTCEGPVTCAATFTVTAAPAVVLTCPSNQTVAACQTQAAVDAAYNSWLTTVSFSGGCNAAISNNSAGAPPACGGTVTVTWTVTSTCEGPVTCAATFTVTAAPAVVLTCPSNQTVAACQTQAAVDAAYNSWLTTVSFSGGCNAAISNNSAGAPPACGGSVTVTWTVTSTCEGPVTCAATFTVTNAPVVALNCATNQTEAACQTQTAINNAFNTWLNSATFSGGCNAMISNNGGAAPSACGGSTTVTWTVTSTCESPVTCSAVFTVTAAPLVVLNCAANQTEAPCQTQTAINNAFNIWLNTTTFSGGCNAAISNSGGAAPSACGGSTTVTWTVTSSCEANVTCSAVFTVNAAPLVVLNCATNQTEAACQTQAAIDAAYATWLATATFTGGCNATISNNGGSAPPACGGSKTVIWTVTSTCEANVTCSAVFTVLDAPVITLNCANNQTEAACQTQAAIDAAYATWLTTANFTGGCSAMISNNGGSAPPACGVSKTVTWTVTHTCGAPVTCSAVFTVSNAPAVVLTCPTNQTVAACQTQAAVDAAYNSWLTIVSFSGGCSASISNNSAGAPPACGGSVTVTWTVTSTCEGPVTCAATFTVTNAPAVVLTCPSNQTVAACQTQAAVDAAYNSWLTTVSFSGGCSAAISNNSAGAPPACGGSVTVTWTVTSTCEGPVTCAATFTVTAAPAVVLTCPSNQTVAACQTQAAVDAAYNSWLTTVSFSGGCNAAISNNSAGAPPACGGSVTVTWTVTSTCQIDVTCSASFTVTAAPSVALTCPPNRTRPSCLTQTNIDNNFANWLTLYTLAGGCNAAISNNNTGAPNRCGGSTTVTFTVTSSCEGPVTCSASYTVTAAPLVALNCASNQTEAACQTQTAINNAFSTWINSATFTGGCDATISNNNTGAPPACGGSTTVIWTVTSSCEANVTCSAVFTVTAAPPVMLSCPANQTEAACQTQAAIDAAYAAWLATATSSGGCNASVSNDGGAAPPACGGSKTVTWTVTSTCEPNSTCSAVFTVTAAPVVSLTCPANQTEAACQTQAAIDAAYTAWLNAANFSGGCFAAISNNGGAAPSACGETKTVIWTVTSTCESPVTCSAVFTVSNAPAVVLNCPANQTQAACQSQATIDAAYAAWLTAVSFSGGCSAAISNNSPGAPSACGGSVTVTWTVTSTCEGPATCTSSFTVTAAPAVVLTCPSNQTVAACQTQAAVDAAYNTWLTTVSFSGGCNAAISNNSAAAPPACGGSVTVTWTVTSSCQIDVTCSASFTVTAAPALVLTCPVNNTQAACQTQAAVDATFNTWLTTVSFSGGCSAAISNNSAAAPPACGGSVTVTWTVTSSCQIDVTCSASFTVTAAPSVDLTCPPNRTRPSCLTQTNIDNNFANWLTLYTLAGGCNAAISNNNTGAPNRCGGSTTVTFTVTSSCEGPVTCSASYTVTAAPLVALNCASNQTEAACQTQTAINNAFSTWINSATFTGGCDATISNNNTGAPPACGGSTTVIWTVTSSCEANVTCSAVFTVTAAPPVMLSCPANQTEAACQTQAAIDAAYAAWLATATSSGGCNASVSNDGGAAPPACGGSKTVTWTVTSTCEPNSTCSAVFTVTAAPVVSLTCPANQTEAACQTQAAIDAAYTAWLNAANFSGGCFAAISNNGGAAPSACGETKTVIWTVTSTCEAPVTCSAVFTVSNAPAVVLNCPANQTQAACQSQATIDAAYAAWLTAVSFSGGCSAAISNNSPGAPSACGGSVTVTWTVTSTCEGPATCTSSFTVTASPAVVLTCPSNQTVAACQTQAAVDAAFNTWLTTVSFSGGCNAAISNNSAAAPPACGGSVTVTWTVTSSCQIDVTCSASFTVTAAPTVVLTCPVNNTQAACQTQAAVDATFNTWLTTVSFSGGCNAAISNNSAAAPPACGGSVTVTWTVTSSCAAPVTCSASFTVTAAPAVVLNCPANNTQASCQTQVAIDAAYNTWLTSVSSSGGCNAAISNNGTGAPNACGGSTTVTWTVTSTCEGPVTCSASFTVTDAPVVVLNCPVNNTQSACQTQAAIDAAYAAWLATATSSGGCNASVSNNGGAAPLACGGSKTVTWTVTSSCEGPVTCSAVFTVTAAPPVMLSCPANQTQAACQTQSAIDAAYAAWLATATSSGGCNASVSNNGGAAPPACGGSKTVTWTVTSTCEPAMTCSAVFSVTAAPVVSLTCPANQTEAACQTQAAIDAAYTAWLATATSSGGCNASVSNNGGSAPPACGGSKTVTWTVTSSCEPAMSCSAVFTVTAAPAISLTCPVNQTHVACQSQASVDAAFASWLTTVNFSGGCNANISNNSTSAPPACGGATTVTWTVTSSCAAAITCSASFTVTAAPAVVLNCPVNNTQAACQSQTAIDAAFNTWLTTVSFSGGCNADISNNSTNAPPACGGSTTVIWTVTSNCASPVTCSASFTVTAAPALVLTCPVNNTQAACQTQAAVDAAYNTWLTTVSFSGGCNAAISNTGGAAPPACGGSTTVTWTVTSSCAAPVTCSASFTVTAAPAVVLNCPANNTQASCQTQVAIDAAYNTWLTSVSSSGGCNAAISNNGTGAPNACGGSITVTWTVTSTCEGPVTCSASFTVTSAPVVVLNCPVNNTQSACQTQAAIDAAYAAWLATATSSGGCNASVSNNGGAAPLACGGSKTVTWTVTSSCEGPVTCSAVFTVTAAPPVMLSCPANQTQAACQTQAAIDAAYAAWLATATSSGGCNASVSNNGGAAPPACGGSKTVTWTVTSTCEPAMTCSAVFSVTAAPVVSLTCPANQTEAACQTQAAIDAAYTAWLATATSSGGCNASVSNNGGSAPPACGGSKTVTWTVTSSCEPAMSCSAVFTVTAAPAISLTCPVNQTHVACQSQASVDAAFASWLTTVNFSGGCNANISNNSTSAPPACGGATTVTWTVTSSCAAAITCSASFTVTAAPAVVLNCPANNTQAACQSQTAIDAAFNTWLTTVSFSGGCNADISNNSTNAPPACGGSTTVIWTVTSNCASPVTCSASFTVTAAPAVVLTCPVNNTQAACQTQAAVDAAYNTWLTTVSFSGGCNAAISNTGGVAPPACGGSVTVTWTVTSSCAAPVTCSASFTVTAAPAVVLNCPANNTQASCQTQVAIDAVYNTWLTSVSSSGGCNAVISNNGTGAPNACGGSTTVTWTVTSTCAGPVTCSASFTVTSAPAVILNCPSDTTIASCQTQANIDAAYAAWLATVTSSGGCNASVSNNGGAAPPACGGSKTVTWTVTSSCVGPVTCSAVFTVTASEVVALSCPSNNIQVACQTQAVIDAAYTAWLNATSVSGGCNATISNNGGAAPAACGGSKTVVWTVTSSCEADVTCSATFTVNAPANVSITCAVNQTMANCPNQSTVDSTYTAWLNSAGFSGGCNAALSHNGGAAPLACGGSKTVTWTVTSSCEPAVTCSAVFTVTTPASVNLKCPTPSSTSVYCLTQAQVDDFFLDWLDEASTTGGCNVDLTNNNSGAPSKCGGVKTVTFTATSSCDITKSCSSTFTVSAQPPPSVTCPPAITISCAESELPPNTGFATGADYCGKNVVLSYDDQIVPGNCPGNYVINRTWTATDSCNNIDFCSQLITVIDTIEPSFTIPANQSVYTQATPSGNKVLVNYNFNSGYSYISLSPKLYSGIYSKVDTSSNAFLTVNGIVSGANAFDNNAIAGKGLSVNNSMVAGHWQFNLTGHNLPAFSNFEVYVQAFRKGNGSATDLLMDYSTNGINWTNFSTTALIQNQWVECIGNINGANNPASLFIRVYYSGGNSQQTKELHIDNFQVRADNEDIPCDFAYVPDITGYPTNVVHPCDAAPAVSYSDSLVFGECSGTQVFRTWTVTDFCGNSSTGASPQIITVSDTTGPVITCPSNDTITRKVDTMTCQFIVPNTTLDAVSMDECTDSSGVINNWNNSHTLLGQVFIVGFHTITWTATDDCGNTSTCKYVLNVYETEPPVAKCKDFNIYLDSLGLYTLKIDSINNGSTDNCGIKSMKLSRYVFGCDDLPKRTVILTVTDSTGLSDTCTANLNIIDTIKPVIVCKSYNIALPSGGGSKFIHPDSVLLIKKDNCGIKTKVTNPDSITCKSPKNTIVTVTVTDVNGNSSSCTAVVTISNYVDSDCDGVINVCDVCPNGDDSVDNNGDGKPDCKYPPAFKQIKASWKCGTNPNRVYIAEIGNNGICTTRCVRYSDFINNQGPNQFLGPCISCPELFKGGGQGDEVTEANPDEQERLKDVDLTPDGFRIIPNPNHGIFELLFNNTIKEGTIKIYNLLGEEVWKMQIEHETDEVQIHSNSFKQKAAGVYRVVVNSGSAKTVQSLIILQ
ncbi:MAG: T9SS type A sorting domain-containing protein [Saprospiraceae bacterium]|nr:T9SS type A sorting domain-containing protein [Saprospiraceae bacterium]